MKSSQTHSRRSKTGPRDGHDLRRAFDKELRRLVRRASRHPGTEDVHAVRKGITRLRSWLRLVREEIGTAEFRAHNGRLRRAGRLLAPIRDARVMLAAFEALGVGAKFPDTSKHLRRQSRGATKAAGAVMRQVKRRLDKELTASERLPLKQITAANFAVALERMLGEKDTAFAAARASGSVELLHTWRKRSKNYLHALALLAGTKNRRHQATARINRLLGEDHDLALLETELARHGHEPESRALLTIIAARREKLRRRFFPEPRRQASQSARSKPNVKGNHPEVIGP